MLTSQVREEYFEAVEFCSTLLQISQQKQSCDVNISSTLHRFRIRRKFEQGLTVPIRSSVSKVKDSEGLRPVGSNEKYPLSD